MTIASYWASPILTSEIIDKATADATITHILSSYNLESPPGEINDHNIFDDDRFDAFLKNIVEPAFDEYLTQTLGKRLYDFEERSYRGWITGTTPGYNMLTHNHSGSQLSAVFYLLNEEADAGGDIVFLDPRSNANRSYKINDWGKWFEPIRLKTPSYTFAVFPSFVYHQVTPYTGKLRIAIPVDLFV
jgi:hypothetical protein